MATVSFSQNILTHVEVPPSGVSASTVREALTELFSANPKLRSYLLNDDGTPRKHVAFVVNGEPIKDREGLSDPLDPDAELFVMQALSGG